MVLVAVDHGVVEAVALAVPAIDAPYFGELARHIVKAAERHSYTVLIEQTDGLAQREKRLFADGGPHLIDGLILSPVALRPKDLRARVDQTPLVLLGERVYHGPADHVAIDNVAAARTATAHLLELGRRRIAAIGCRQTKDSSAEHLRYRGYAAALNDAGAGVERRLVVSTRSLDRPGGALAIKRLLALEELPDAVFCYNDVMALGAIRTLLDRGYRVPQDVAVVGIDDIEDGRFSTPSLTTISPDKVQIANLVVDLLVSRIREGNAKPPREVDASATEPATGSRRTPVTSGLYALRNWKYCVTRKTKPDRAKNATVTAPLAAVNLGFSIWTSLVRGRVSASLR